MAVTYVDFKSDLLNEVAAVAQSESLLTEDAFFDVVTDIIVDSGDLETADRCYFVKHGIRVDGYGGDPIDADGVLSLIICDYNSDIELVNANKVDIETVCKRASNFVSSSLSARFVGQLDESSLEYGLADLIKQRWGSIRKVRIIYVTTKLVNLRKGSFEPIPINGISAEFTCWDLARLHSFVVSGKEKEPVNIQISDYGGSVSVLPAHQSDSEFCSYLCVIPARLLALIYGEFGTQLLEKNVRVFLQAKGSVNRGIRRSLENEPARFFAYNNGITATGESIETSPTKMGISLDRISDFQIVNGGQTTASIFDAHVRGVSLEKVFVQMKLTIVSKDRSAEVVRLISRYANSQNRVTEADFFSNHPFHVSFEKLSRRLVAPPKANSTIQTHWFYERARGQYPNAKQACMSTGERKKFESLNPRDQLITKTDLAKVLNTFRGFPHIVSKGAQASFRFFAEEINQKWESGESGPSFVNEKFFKDSISRVILFRFLEKEVSLQSWYHGGYRANVVCYALALFSARVKAAGKLIDYSQVWATQQVPNGLGALFIELAEYCHSHLIHPPSGSPSNITEYAKTEKCWELFSSSDCNLDNRAMPYLRTKSKDLELERISRKNAVVDSAVDLQIMLLEKGGAFWAAVLEYSSQNNLVTPSDWQLLSRATQFPSRPLENDKDYKRLDKLLERAIKHGLRTS
jgi:hypothetical protein